MPVAGLLQLAFFFEIEHFHSTPISGISKQFPEFQLKTQEVKPSAIYFTLNQHFFNF